MLLTLLHQRAPPQHLKADTTVQILMRCARSHGFCDAARCPGGLRPPPTCDESNSKWPEAGNVAHLWQVVGDSFPLSRTAPNVR